MNEKIEIIKEKTSLRCKVLFNLSFKLWYMYNHKVIYRGDFMCNKQDCFYKESADCRRCSEETKDSNSLNFYRSVGELCRTAEDSCNGDKTLLHQSLSNSQ